MVKIDPGGKRSSSTKDPAKMTRSEALMTLGAMAAGMPLLKGVVPEFSSSGYLSSRIMENIPEDPILTKAISELEYLTPTNKFIVQRRGNPVIPEIPPEKLSAIGLTHETWKLEILPDPESDSELGIGLFASRVGIAASMQAHLILRILLGEER